MINCQECADFIIDYVEGNLSDGVADDFKIHLEKCPPCLEYVESYRETMRVTKSLCCEEEKKKLGCCPESLIQKILLLRKDCDKQ